MFSILLFCFFFSANKPKRFHRSPSVPLVQGAAQLLEERLVGDLDDVSQRGKAVVEAKKQENCLFKSPDMICLWFENMICSNPLTQVNCIAQQEDFLRSAFRV